MAFDEPWATMKLFRPSTVIPLRRTPRTVGNRGSSLQWTITMTTSRALRGYRTDGRELQTRWYDVAQSRASIVRSIDRTRQLRARRQRLSGHVGTQRIRRLPAINQSNKTVT